MLLFLTSTVLFMTSVTTGAVTTNTIQTYETNAQYLVGTYGNIIQCSTSQNQLLTFNILNGNTGKAGHKSFRSTMYLSTYITGHQPHDNFLRLSQPANGYMGDLWSTFTERNNHFFQGTSSYESILLPGYFMMCENGFLQFGQPRTDKQAMRASFVLHSDSSSTKNMWGSCSRTCGGGTQERKPTCFGGVCEEIQKRRCNTEKCPSRGACSPNPCQNGGTCSSNFWGTAKCTCHPDYKGKYCQTQIHPCDSLTPCKNGGVCKKVGNKYRCDCRNGYTGIHCETEPHLCESYPCLNGGKCIKFTKDYLCECTHQYTGRNCETLIRARCTPNYCRNGGTCVETGNGLRCDCTPQYEGDKCQRAKNPCDSSPCMNGGDCERVGSTSFKCNCKPKYTGKRCENQVANPCDKRPCLNGGTCVRNGATDFSCNCSPQFTGPFCGSQVVNPCNNNPCQNGGTCVRSGTTNFYCKCVPQFTGSLCENKVADPCDSQPCLNGGSCVSFTKTFVCNCAPGYTGETCDIPLRQSCTSSYCKNGGTCIEASNGLKCKCAPGWQGDRCTDDVQGFQWSACSKTCGPGTRYRKCRSNDVRKCERRYEDCNLKSCPDVNCGTYRFNSKSECCKMTASSTCGFPTPASTSRRIIGGVTSKDAQWPWQVSMWKKVPKIFFCGGALVSTNWVITAGHCAKMSGVAQHEMLIEAGGNKLSGNNPGLQTSDVEKIITHPTFNNPIDDIALLKLTKPFTFTQYVKPICFPNGEVVDNDVICYAAGWGASSATDLTARRPSNSLLHVGLRTLPMDACVQGFKNTGFGHGVTARTLCAGVLVGGKDTCIGDSGGPFVCQRQDSCQWFLAGIGSFGPTQCGIGYIPAVFMDVAKYEKWLKDQMAQN